MSTISYNISPLDLDCFSVKKFDSKYAEDSPEYVTEYKVNLRDIGYLCTCTNYRTTKQPCKHYYMVLATLKPDKKMSISNTHLYKELLRVKGNLLNISCYLDSEQDILDNTILMINDILLDLEQKV
jgi:hypothetical protein